MSVKIRSIAKENKPDTIITIATTITPIGRPLSMPPLLSMIK